MGRSLHRGLVMSISPTQRMPYVSSQPLMACCASRLTSNQDIYRFWLQVIWLAFGVSLIFLSLALHERLKGGSPVLARTVTIFTLIWAVLVIVVGALSINDLGTVVRLQGADPAQAATVWLTLDTVETGLGAGGGETIVTGLWFLLLSWAALQARALPKLLNYLGAVVGVAGILYVFTASTGLLAANALGLVIWFVWLGIVMLRTTPMLRTSPVPAARASSLGI